MAEILPGNDTHFIESYALWLGPLAVVSAGSLVALVIIFFNKKIQNKPRTFFIGAAAGCALFCITVASTRFFYNRHHDPYFNNEENNESFLNNTSTYPRQEKMAFDTIINKYEDKDSIRLAQASVMSPDSIIAGKPVHYYVVRFDYWKKGFHNTLFQSGCLVINDTAHLQYFERIMSAAEKHQYDSTIHSEMNYSLIKDILKTYQDSLKKIK